MSLEAFATQVSIDELLTHDEKVSIFQYIGGVRTEKQKFNRNIRLKQCLIVRRFDQDVPLKPWSYGSNPDVLNFVVSTRAKFLGVGLFTPTSQGRIVGQTKLKCGTCTLASKDDVEIEYDPSKFSEEVLFDMPVNVEAGKEYSVHIKLSGSDTYYGTCGKTIVSSGNLAVAFAKSEESQNGTTVSSEQIHSLLFWV